jgi:hypothetical protein
MSTSTPWGPSHYKTRLAPGIMSYGTARHGGIHLSDSLYTQLPEPLQKTFAGGAWYEEDCDWSIPYLWYSQEIKRHIKAHDAWEWEHWPAKVERAYQIIARYRPEVLHMFTELVDA